MNEKINTVLKLRNWVHIAHHIPGRIRLRYKLGIIAHLARFNANDIEKALSNIPAFRNYTLNRSTGSILIEYDPSIVDPTRLEALFSPEDMIAERACNDLAECLNLNGVNQ
ncbi:hypothetical protein VA7868_02481 [Vibrio aerogenes CECT 7868]|uniref:Cation transporter n=1 Tax=Vibrio aerogenes CECT 7868 TaxID=1216006 RepID=A0A1M5ZAA6_9VIBR|nr:heavy-metal-associated domain-containing protein [Vibrio aerogenes]SHI21122.1 hypothetical protein VA7868_02481 [Vibrio aerogenes CECT 7868]